MNKKDTIVTDVVIQALKMEETIKRQEVIIERLRSENNELHMIITKLKNHLLQFAPDSIIKLELFHL